MKYAICAVALSMSFCMLTARQHELAVVIPSYNNAQWYQKNLDSVFIQKDQNYHVFYIDDASTDNTADLVQDYVQRCGKQDRVTLIRNNNNQGALANIYKAVHALPDDTIVVNLDGDDWLADDQVLSRIHVAYSHDNVWMTYGQYVCYPRNIVGHCRTIPEGIIYKNAYREYDWITSHLRTFYAGLFKKIELKDLLDESGKFFSVTGDMAWMFPILEMAGNHVHFISDVQYVYNQDTPLNDFRTKFIEQIHCDRLIRSRAKYKPLTTLFTEYKKPVSVGAVVIGSSAQSCAALEKMVRDVVLGLASVHEVDAAVPDFAQEIRSFIDATMCTHLLLVDEGTQLPFIDIMQCVQELERTNAHAVYFDMPRIGSLCARSVQRPAGQMLNNDFCAWQFKHGSFEWRMPYSLHGALYRAADVSALCNSFKPMAARLMIWFANQTYFDMERLGLFYRKNEF